MEKWKKYQQGLWKNKAFRQLSIEMKILWVYIYNNSNDIGIFEADWETIKLHTGVDYNPQQVFDTFGDNIIPLDDFHLWLPDYCLLNHPELKEETRSNHLKSLVIQLKEWGCFKDYRQTLNEPYGNLYNNLFKLSITFNPKVINGRDKKDIKSYSVQKIKELFEDEILICPKKIQKQILVWLEYKLARNERYKNLGSMQAMINRLINYSDNNVKKAEEIIENAMAMNYRGFFRLIQTQGDTRSTRPKTTIGYKEPNKTYGNDGTI